MSVSALQNPNNRRTINLIARYADEKKMSADKAAALWFSERQKPAKSRTIRHAGKGKSFGAALKASKGAILKKLKPSSKDHQHHMAKLKREVAHSLAKAYGMDKKKAGRYVRDSLGGQGKRYRSSEKKVTKVQKGGFRKGKEYSAVDVSGVRSWNHSRVARRAAGQWGHAHGIEKRPMGKDIAFSKKYPKAVESAKKSLGKFKGIPQAKPQAWEMGGKKAKPAARSRRAAPAAASAAPAAAGRRGPVAFNDLVKKIRKQHPYMSYKDAQLAAKEIYGAGYRNNPDVSALGDLAFTNPAVGLKDYVVAYALPVTVAGAVAGGVHAAAAHYNVTEKISEYAAKIPVVGEYIAKVPFTIQGLLVGSALAFAATKTSGKVSEQLALAGGAAIVFGGGIDTFNIVKEKLPEAGGDVSDVSALGDLAFTNMGDLAFTNMGELGFTEGSTVGDLAFTNGSAPYGDGMAYQTAPLTAQDYLQASLHDASYSGADFSEVEGQALLNGRQDFLRRFGNAPYKMGSTPKGASHLAGRPGHRWGWLVKLLGWERAQRIAAMEPKDRLQVIRKIRAAALAAAQQASVSAHAEELAHQAQMAPAPSDLISASPAGAAGASSVTGSTGDFGELGDLAFTNTGDLGYGDPALFSMA